MACGPLADRLGRRRVFQPGAAFAASLITVIAGRFVAGAGIVSADGWRAVFVAIATASATAGFAAVVLNVPDARTAANRRRGEVLG